MRESLLRKVRHCLMVVLIPGVIFGSAMPGNAQTKPAPAKGPVALGKPGNEIKDVTETIHRVASVRELADMGDYLDNESAAVLGIVLSIPVIMAAQMEGMGTAMGKAAGAPTKASAAPGKASKDIEAVFKKFGLTPGGGNNPAEMKKLIAQGRPFFREMTKLLDGLDKGGAKGGMMKPVQKWRDTSQFKFKVLNAREVQVTPPPPDQQKIKAVVEQGFWRMHVMGMDDLKRGGMGGPPK